MKLPSKWKKWLVVRLPAPVVGGTVPSSGTSATLWLGSVVGLLFNDCRHVGQEVSCSSQERRQELYINKQS